MTQAPDLGFVHRYIPAADPSRPPLLLLHGTGADENDLIPLGEMLAPGAAILSPRGRVSEEGLNRFFRRHEEGVWDLPDFETRTNELAGFLARARAVYHLAPPVVLGFSNGANIGWSLMRRDPDQLAGALLMRAMLPFDPRPLPDLTGFPVLLLSGKDDPLVPSDQPSYFAALLGEAGADVTLEMVPAGHTLTQQDLIFAFNWLERYFPAQA
ncbi:alpha/beta hydrolase [Pseudorhodoplanes sinuspersici]|uniref:Hydrolase n=1 Tax=Pseudorhodoplanes sinuspersici TaxID=1235591 RepID=A0A1W6ZVS2_9HYPH|nr:alpha/beta hydrolase [Pseudorhodoplanes sinuspersici]ARQ01416.1 hydrolase [Pseudorhodoplanes sinuspersici]RKE73103.1 phospholipase/carboxylesterase [Pseudorhodoplanes sinuspersici]